ncbi:MAG: protein-disulfide reductase DsbD [Arenicellales bacterium]
MIRIQRLRRGFPPAAIGLVLFATGLLTPAVAAPAPGGDGGGQVSRESHQDVVQALAQSSATDTASETAQDQQTLLKPRQAFRFEARLVSPGRLRATWRIAQGYYMYRRSFSVTAMNGDAALGKPVFPKGRMKHDENFGDVEIYDSDVTFTVPIDSTPLGEDRLVIQAVGQGCNEPIGVCFPPVTETATIPLTAAGESSQNGASSGSGIIGSLQALMGGGSSQQEFLRPDEAFKLRLEPTGPRALVAKFSIEPGYYLYKDKIAVESETPDVKVTAVELPQGKKKTDPNFGEVYAFHHSFDAFIALTRGDAGPREASFRLKYQGCAEAGICYPPIEKTVSLRLPGDSGATSVSGDAGGTPPPAAGSGFGGSKPASGGLLAGLSLVLLAFGSGLLLTFTPCVLPMIPILAGIIVGQGSSVTRTRGGSLAAVYVLGTAVTYTAVGVVAGLTGDQLQAHFQNAWAIGLIAALLGLMALSMFGFYELKMPSAIQTHLQHRATGLKAGAYGGVFLMGILSALIVGACVSPVLISILSLAIKRADPVLGGAIMFAMALGMGLVLVALGFGFGHFLPKTGPWMETVKHVFGLLLLAVAVYLLGALPRVPVLYLWAALMLGTAVYLGSGSFRHRRRGWRWMRQLASVALVAWSVLAVIGGVQGSRDILRPVNYQALAGARGGQPVVRVDFRQAPNPQALAGLMKAARAEGKPVMIDYYADWCVDCVRMEKSTFATPRVARALNDEFVLIQVDLTDPDDPGTRAIKQAHDVYGPPAVLFFDRQGREIRSLRRYGYMNSRQFLHHIQPLRES